MPRVAHEIRNPERDQHGLQSLALEEGGKAQGSPGLLETMRREVQDQSDRW